MLIIITLTLTSELSVNASSSTDKVIYPLKEISKLDCRFKDFDELSNNCKQQLPILKTKDYAKYASKNWWYNDFTRLYTMLWWASYKYGWDVWNGWHIWTDIATSKWTPVYSIADWKVIKTKNDVMEWLTISIEHKINWKYIVSNYFHLSKIEVKKWDIVKVWTEIWKVWSTWNSTWNHLHFQIDLKTPFHPYYYDYNKCPFSYYKITEDWVCFDELAKNTIDPLLFLETRWAILEKITQVQSSYNNNSSNNEDLSIFNRSVYIWSPKVDIKKIQEIFKIIWFYKWKIDWNYSNVEKDIIRFQIDKKLIENKNSYWAWYFWPKTRYQAKKDYLNSNKKITNNSSNTTKNESKIKTVKIERKNLLSREEIEKMEVDSFLKNYNIELNFSNQWSNIKKWSIEILKLKITNKKWRVFKWAMPGWMTFVVNTEKVNVFPKKLFYFTDGKRDIRLTWLNEWNTNLYVKIWAVTVKTIKLKVYNSNKTIYPESAKILSSWKITLWEKKTWIVLFKDKEGKNLINLPYGSTFNIKASENNKICIKKWNIKDIRNIYKSKCSDDDYKNEISFSYEDTVWWLLIYDFKATNNNFKVSIKNNYNNQNLYTKNIAVSNPKWLNKTYVYTNEVMQLLQKWIVDWIKRGYFLEKRWLSQKDAFNWIKNALVTIQNDSYNKSTIEKIENNISEINKMIPYSSVSKTITREEFLDITSKYLIFNDNDYSTITFRDLDQNSNEKVSKIFNNNNTWKDKFWENYFRPKEKITRWEWVYFLAQSLNRIHESYLTLK